MQKVDDFETLKALLTDLYECSFDNLRKLSKEEDNYDPDHLPESLIFLKGHAVGQNETASALFLAIYGRDETVKMWDESIHRWDEEYGKN